MNLGQQTILREEAREIPTLLEVDVLVAGGGTTGPIAAIAAARQGVKVAMVEKFGSLGGTLTLGLNTKPHGALSGGLPKELWDLARSMNAAGTDYELQLQDGKALVTSPCDPETMKLLLVKLCDAAGVQLLFECMASEPVLDENKTIQGVIIEGKGGRQFIKAKVVIDCSADGDIAARAGAPYVLGAGDEQANLMQPVTMYFTIRNVDLNKLVSWARNHPEHVPDQHIPADKKDWDYGLWLTGFNKLLQQYQQDTGIRLQRENITLKTAHGEVYVNATRVRGVSGLSPVDSSNAQVECYRQIEAYSAFLKEHIPGFEASRLGTIASALGIRETRHIVGEYVLSGSDAFEGATFDDAIVVDTAPFDFHEAKGANVHIRAMGPYEIPYRCLVPLNVEQLLIAGRCISADHTAHGRSRNMPACMATGQAAGIAAALAVKTDLHVRNLDVAQLQKALSAVGAPFKAAHLNANT